jgi:hypothetical protein
MPKHEIFHKAGEPVAKETKWIIDRFFDSKQAEKLERLGGRILISVAAPYKGKKPEKVTIDDSFLSRLKTKRNNIEELRSILDNLTIKELKIVCNLVHQPVQSNATSEQIKRELIRSLRAEDFWGRISEK